jgi:hypothetical protein
VTTCNCGARIASVIISLNVIATRWRIGVATDEDKGWLTELIDQLDDGGLSAAEVLVNTCRRCDIALSLDADGTLIVTGTPWPSLRLALREHSPAIIELLRGTQGEEAHATVSA